MAEDWLDVGPTGGTLAGGASTTVVTWLTDDADALLAGVYTDTLTVANTTFGTNVDLAAELTVVDPVDVTPTDGFLPVGPLGGPFAPATATYTLTNNGIETVSWSGNGVRHVGVRGAGQRRTCCRSYRRRNRWTKRRSRRSRGSGPTTPPLRLRIPGRRQLSSALFS